jgi:DNA-binding GntR family transcriptional regulator
LTWGRELRELTGMQRKIERSGTMAQEIATQIRDRIISGALAPGQRLVEARLARELGTSRAPIREAARLLESEGMLSFDPNRGFSARQVTLRELIEVYDLRVAIERHAAAKAAERRNPRLLEALQGHIKAIREAREADEFDQAIEADLAFHQAIVTATSNRRLIRVYSDAETEMRLILRLVGEAETDGSRIADSHLPVIEAIMRGTPLDAANQMEAHIRLFWDDVLRQIHETSTIPLVPLPKRRKG